MTLVLFLSSFFIIELVCYKGVFLYKVLIGGMICGCSFLLEMAAAYFVAVLHQDILKVVLLQDVQATMIIVISKYMIFAFALFLSKRKSPRYHKNKVPCDWMIFAMVPICSLLLIVCFFLGEETANISLKYALIMIVILLIFAIHIGIYGLLELVSKEYDTRLRYEKELSRAIVYEENSKIQKKYMNDMEVYRHNIKRDYFQMRTHIVNGEYDVVLGMLEQGIKDMYVVQPIINAGVMELDNLLNHKITYARSIGIKLNVTVRLETSTLPADIKEICILIEHLLDMAIESCGVSQASFSIGFQLKGVKSSMHIVLNYPYMESFDDETVFVEKAGELKRIIKKLNGSVVVEDNYPYRLIDISLVKE